MKYSNQETYQKDYVIGNFFGVKSTPFLERGNAFIEAGRLGDALRIFDQGLDEGQGNYELLVAKGDVLILLESTDEALRSYRLAIAVKPQLAIAYCRLGFALLSLSRYDDARRQFRLGLLIDSRDVDLLKGFAKTLILSGDHKAALMFLFRASLLDLEDPETPSLIARIFFLVGDPDEAFRFAERALSKDPKK